MQKPKVVSQTIQYGKQQWRINPDGSWSAMVFGAKIGQTGHLCWHWIYVPEDKVPKEVKELTRNGK